MRNLYILSGILSIGLFAVADSAEAGCDINLKVKNSTGSTICVNNSDVNGSAVKVKNGTWKKLIKGSWNSPDESIQVTNGSSTSDVYKASFKCSKKRQYKIRYNCGPCTTGASSSHTKYHPSSSSFTTKQTVTITLKDC